MRTFLTTLTMSAVAVLAMGCQPADDMRKAVDPTPTERATTSAPAEPVETVTETVTAEPEPEPEPEPVVEDDLRAGLDDDMIDTLFLDLVRDSYPAMFYGVDDSDVLMLAEGVCGQFDIGQTFADVVTTGVDSGYTYEQIGGFIGASIAGYCPEHDGVVPN